MAWLIILLLYESDLCQPSLSTISEIHLTLINYPRNLLIMMKVIESGKKVGIELQVPFYFPTVPIPGSFIQWLKLLGVLRQLTRTKTHLV